GAGRAQDLPAGARLLGWRLVLPARRRSLGKPRSQSVCTQVDRAWRTLAPDERDDHARYPHHRRGQCHPVGEPRALRAGRAFVWRLDHLGGGRAGGEKNLVDRLSRRLYAGERTARARYQFSAQSRRDRRSREEGRSVTARTASFGVEGEREGP